MAMYELRSAYENLTRMNFIGKGVKNGLKKDTIIKKIEEAGYSYNYETSKWKRKK